MVWQIADFLSAQLKLQARIHEAWDEAEAWFGHENNDGQVVKPNLQKLFNEPLR